MAEAFLNKLGKDKFFAESAGIEPGVLNQKVVKVMSELGYDISGNKTKSVFDIHASGKTYDFIITVCDPEAAEKCPVFPGNVKREHWGFRDPSGFTGTELEILGATRIVRDEIKSKVLEFIENN